MFGLAFCAGKATPTPFTAACARRAHLRYYLGSGRHVALVILVQRIGDISGRRGIDRRAQTIPDRVVAVPEAHPRDRRAVALRFHSARDLTPAIVAVRPVAVVLALRRHTAPLGGRGGDKNGARERGNASVSDRWPPIQRVVSLESDAVNARSVERCTIFRPNGVGPSMEIYEIVHNMCDCSSTFSQSVALIHQPAKAIPERVMANRSLSSWLLHLVFRRGS